MAMPRLNVKKIREQGVWLTFRGKSCLHIPALTVQKSLTI